jgi:L-iditol 2-dehydrogenase
MRKLVLKSIGQVGLEEVEKPSIGEQDVLIKVKACGLCGTDLHIFRDPNAFGDPFAHPLGHEITGQVVEVGAKVSHVQVGDGVVIDNATNCGVCRNCKNGDPGGCTNIINLLLEDKVVLQEYVAVPARSVYKFEGLSYAEATLAEPLTVALEMLATAEVGLGQDVVVVGPGPIGLMAARVARHMGARSVYVLARSGKPGRLQLAEKLGAEVVLMDQVDLVEYFAEKNIQFDRALVTAPPSTINRVIPLMTFAGIITYIGFEFGGKEQVALDLNHFHVNKLQLRATHAIPNRFYPIALDLIKQGVIEPGDFISQTFLLEQVQQAFEAAVQGDAIKTLITLE